MISGPDIITLLALAHSGGLLYNVRLKSLYQKTSLWTTDSSVEPLPYVQES